MDHIYFLIMVFNLKYNYIREIALSWPLYFWFSMPCMYLGIIGVLGSFFRGGQQFLSSKTQSCSAKKYPLRLGQILQFRSAKLMYHSFVSQCSASLNIGQKLLKDDSKTDINGRKIGKYGRNQTKMAESRQTWQKTWQNMEEKGNAGHALFLHF